MNKFHLAVLVMFFALISVQTITAQDTDDTDTCIALVRDALDLTRETCESTTGRNQACYGNITLQVEAQPGINALTFEQRGDIVDVESIRTLQLSSLNAEANEWGVAYLRLQTSIEDEIPEDMTMLMFGDVSIENTVDPAPEVVTFEIASTGNINVRAGASTNDAVVTALSSGQTVVADARNDDGSWLRIQLEDGGFGWVFTDLMTVEDDVSTLAVVAGDEPVVPQFGPMQAFIIETGVDDAPCAEAPDSGLLIQTPEGVARIDLVVNEVEIRLRSTAYLQSQPGGELVINVLEGSARVRVDDTRKDAPAGTRIRVPMDANSIASGPPSDPEPYDDEQIAVIPVDALPQVVEILPAMSEEELEEINNELLPMAGLWMGYTGSAEILTEMRPVEDGLFIKDWGGEITIPLIRPGVYDKGSESVPNLFEVRSKTLIEWTYDGDVYRTFEYIGEGELPPEE